MILRFKNQKGNCINMDTAREEHSEEFVAGKNYISVSDDDYNKISAELDFNQYAFRDSLTIDTVEELPLF